MTHASHVFPVWAMLCGISTPRKNFLGNKGQGRRGSPQELSDVLDLTEPRAPPEEAVPWTSGLWGVRGMGGTWPLVPVCHWVKVCPGHNVSFLHTCAWIP